MTLPVLSGADRIRVLERLGYRVVRQRGSHARLNHSHRRPIAVPLHRELERGTVRSILRTAELGAEELLEALG